MGVVERGAHKVVHACVYNHEGAAFAFLHIKHLCHQHAGVADDQAAGLEHQLAAERIGVFADNRRIAFRVIGIRIFAFIIGDSKTAAEVDMVYGVAVFTKRHHEVGEQGESVVKRRKVGDLRPDVHVDARHGEAGQLRGACINLTGARQRHAEFVFRLSGRDFPVRLGVNVRVNAHRDPRGPAQLRRHARDFGEFRLGLDVEALDVSFKPQRDFRRGLADTGKCDARSRHAGCAGAPQFAFRYNIHACAKARQRCQHGLIGVCLHGVTDQHILIGERVAEHIEMTNDRRRRIAIERRADFGGQIPQVHIFGMQDAVDRMKMTHALPGELEDRVQNKGTVGSGNRRFVFLFPQA